jgi:hypothetical protein
MVSVIMLNVTYKPFVLSVVRLIVVMLIVVALFLGLLLTKFKRPSIQVGFDLARNNIQPSLLYPGQSISGYVEHLNGVPSV